MDNMFLHMRRGHVTTFMIFNHFLISRSLALRHAVLHVYVRTTHKNWLFYSVEGTALNENLFSTSQLLLYEHKH